MPPGNAVGQREPLDQIPTRKAPEMTRNYEKLLETVGAARDDVTKAAEGNKAACARVRKAMQDVKNVAQDIRKEMLELRDSGGIKS